MSTTSTRMTNSGSDLDIFKDIPGYKGILKAVLKSQIQLLVKQLSDQTGEESLFLSANISEGTLSSLGSESGKDFLQDNSDVKKQFLGYCIKGHQHKKSGLVVASTSQHVTQPSTTGFSSNRKPYFRMQRRNTRVRSTGKPFAKILPKPVTVFKNIEEPFTLFYGSRKRVYQAKPLDFQDNTSSSGQSSFITEQGQGHLVKQENQSTGDNGKPGSSLTEKEEADSETSLEQEVIIKVEPEDDVDESQNMKLTETTEDVQPFSDGIVHHQSPNVTMETDRHLNDENQSFEYVLDQDNAGEIITPWKPEENRTNPISSKRKRTLPTRKPKNNETWCKDDEVAGNQPGQSYTDKSTGQKPNIDYMYSYMYADSGKPGSSRMSQQNVSAPREISPLGQSVYGPNIPAFPGYQSPQPIQDRTLDYSIDNGPQNSLTYNPRTSEDSSIATNSASLNWTEESIPNLSPNSVIKTYMKTPPIDGLFVTRGEGRYEKLIKCEECGKVCRTSNMARHKKRYCTSIPVEVRKKQVRSKDNTLNDSPDRIIVDNLDNNGVNFDMYMTGELEDGAFNERGSNFAVKSDSSSSNMIKEDNLSHGKTSEMEHLDVGNEAEEQVSVKIEPSEFEEMH